MGIDFCNETQRQNVFLLFGTKRDMDIKPLYIYLCPVIIFVCFFSIIFNAILMSISRQGKFVNKSPILLLSLNLAVTDLIASLLNGLSILFNSYLPEVYDIKMGQCSMLMFEVVRCAALVASALHLLALAFVHYRGIVNPLHYRSTIFFSQHLSRTINIISLCCWIFPLTIMIAWFSSTPCQGFQSADCDYLFLLGFTYRYMVLSVFSLPLLLMSIIYVRIFVIISRHQRGRRLEHKRSATTVSTTAATNAATAALVPASFRLTNQNNNSVNLTLLDDGDESLEGVRMTMSSAGGEDGAECLACKRRRRQRRSAPKQDLAAGEEAAQGGAPNQEGLAREAASALVGWRPDDELEAARKRGNLLLLELSGGDKQLQQHRVKYNLKRSVVVMGKGLDTEEREAEEEQDTQSEQNNNKTGDCDMVLVDNEGHGKKGKTAGNKQQQQQTCQETCAATPTGANCRDNKAHFATTSSGNSTSSSSGSSSTSLFRAERRRQQQPSEAQTATAGVAPNDWRASSVKAPQSPLVGGPDEADKSDKINLHQVVQVAAVPVAAGQASKKDDTLTNQCSSSTLGAGRERALSRLLLAATDENQQQLRDTLASSSIEGTRMTTSSNATSTISSDQENDENENENDDQDQNSDVWDLCTCDNKLTIKRASSLGVRPTRANTTIGFRLEGDASSPSSRSKVLRDELKNADELERLTNNNNNPDGLRMKALKASTRTAAQSVGGSSSLRVPSTKKQNFFVARLSRFAAASSTAPMNSGANEGQQQRDNLSSNKKEHQDHLSIHSHRQTNSIMSNNTTNYPSNPLSTTTMIGYSYAPIGGCGGGGGDGATNNNSPQYHAAPARYEPQRRHVHAQALPQTNTKALVTTLLILGTYFVSYVPAIIYQVLTCIDHCPYPLYDISFSRRVLFGAMTTLLLIAKSIVDPLIYSYRMNEIQLAINRYLSKRRSKSSTLASTQQQVQQQQQQFQTGFGANNNYNSSLNTRHNHTFSAGGGKANSAHNQTINNHAKSTSLVY